MAEECPDDQTKKKSCKSYASKVFKESSVSAVSAIVSTGSTPRKIFRALVFILFTTGFIYQCVKFLTYVLTYPTIVSIEIKKPESYLAPAFTFCNYNKIKRSKFCAAYPESCEVPTPELCDAYPFYCKNNDTDQVPKEEYYLNHPTFNESTTLQLGHLLEDLLKNVDEIHTRNELPEGPFLRPRWQDGDRGISVCYSLNGRVESSSDPVKNHGRLYWKSPDFTFTFDPEENEVFHPDSQPGVIFDFHSPFDAINPFKKGILLKPGNIYKIILTMGEETLLPYPYKTDCLNYTEKWLKNNKTGPRSQEMCRQLCTKEAYFKCFKCTYKRIDYPSRVRFCTDEETGNNNFCKYASKEDVYPVFKRCLLECKEECSKLHYFHTVAERKILPKWKNGSITQESRYIKVYIEIEDQEVLSLQYKPQYQEVEAFSYIGGFIRIWLGISLVQVADFFESTFRIIRYFFRKGMKCCAKSDSPT